MIHFDEKQPFEEEGYVSAHLHYTTCCCVAQEHFAKRTKKQMKQNKAAKSEGWHFQLSHSAFWRSTKDENGKLYFSYSKLNDQVAKHMQSLGYDVLRGEKGSTAKHLHPNELKALYKNMEEKNRKLIVDMDSFAKDDDGNIILPATEFDKLKSFQSGINTQSNVIEMAQKAIDIETNVNKENRYKNKKKELELEATYGANSNRPRKQIELDLAKAQKKVKEQEEQINAQQEKISFWKESFERVVAWTGSLVGKLKKLMRKDLSREEQTDLMKDIDKQCDEFDKVANTYDNYKNPQDRAS